MLTAQTVDISIIVGERLYLTTSGSDVKKVISVPFQPLVRMADAIPTTCVPSLVSVLYSNQQLADHLTVSIESCVFYLKYAKADQRDFLRSYTWHSGMSK